MVDDVKHITESAESKEALDRARLARERREVEQRKRLDELRAHAAAAQAQREKRDEERRRRQQEQRARDDERRLQVEERKRAIWEASISRRETLLQREKERTERLERARASRSSPRPAFAFGSSTPRLLEPLDSGGFFWAARSTNPIDQMNFFESLAASTTNVMFASAPLTRRASALQLDSSDTDNKDEPDRQPAPMMWSSVARRRTDLVPTLPAPRAPETRSGDTTPGSRPGSAMSNAGVIRRPTSAPRRPRPASIAGTGVNTPRGLDIGAGSAASTPAISRDSTMVSGAGEAPRRRATTPRRPRPASMHLAPAASSTPLAAGDGKPPLHRKPKLSKDHDKTPRGKCRSPGRTLSPTPPVSKESSQDKEIVNNKPNVVIESKQVDAVEVTQKLEALKIHNGDAKGSVSDTANENKETIVINQETKTNDKPQEVESEAKPIEVQKPVEKREEEKPVQAEEKREEKKEALQEKTEEISNEMTASMTARRITTEEEAKAALAERRRRAREELERQAELERQRLQREAEEEAERQRQEEERQRREEQEARELAQLQRQMEEEKLRKAIEAQQQLEREEAERKAREELEKQARAKEDEDKRRAAEEAERLRREDAEKEEKERIARKQRVEAIMARTRLRKAEEEKKQQEKTAGQAPAPATATPSAAAPLDNGNAATGDLLGLPTSQPEETKPQEQTPSSTETAPEAAPSQPPNNGNHTADLLGLSEQNNTEDKPQEQSTKQIDNAPTLEPNNGNFGHISSNVGHISANFIQTERMVETQSKQDVAKLIDDDFTTHNGHGTHPLTLQNAI